MSNTLCVIPWLHLNFDPDGKVNPCCMISAHEYWAGDLNTDSIEDIWNSENMKRLRREMMQGVQPKPCSKCFNKEAATGISNRIHQNRYFPSKLTEIKDITKEDGHCDKLELKYWDFRFSNICNFRCRSCGPKYSSAWLPDNKKLYGDNDQDKILTINSVQGQNKLDFLLSHIHEVEKIYFAGGEPLLMDEHYTILDLLYKHERFNVRIQYNTNMSTLEHKGKNVLDYWKKWAKDKVEIWPSIDEIGDRAELIRKGTVWEQVEENLLTVKELGVYMAPGITVGAMNVFRLPDIIQRLISIGIITKEHNYKNFFINLLEYPKHYHVSILSDLFKEKIAKDLLAFIEEMKTLYAVDLSDSFSYIIQQLSLPHDSEAKKRFIDLTAKLDELRNENTYTVIPELQDVLKNV